MNQSSLIGLPKNTVMFLLHSLLFFCISAATAGSTNVESDQSFTQIESNSAARQTFKLSIAVAANFKPTLERLTTRYKEVATKSPQYPLLEFVLSSGSTGQLFAQINHGAPYDLFFSADDSAPQKLIAKGKALANSKTPYVRGQLAYWQPGSTAPVTQQALSEALTKRLPITLANPRFAPYGMAAQSVINSINLAQPLKLITANNIAHSFQLIDSRQVHGGFVALSYIVAKKIDQNNYWLVPKDLYSDITQSAVILSQSKKSAAAKALLKFLETQSAKEILLGDGYLLAKEN